MVEAPCEDCARDTQPQDNGGDPLFAEWDFYIVHDELWAQAGMEGGFLCTPCIEKRLGRALADSDYQVRTLEVTEDGLRMLATPDFFNKVGGQLIARENP
jgi:hypothetical protein